MGQEFPFNHFLKIQSGETSKATQAPHPLGPDHNEAPVIDFATLSNSSPVVTPSIPDLISNIEQIAGEIPLPPTPTPTPTPKKEGKKKPNLVKEARFTIDFIPSEQDLMDKIDSTVINKTEKTRIIHGLDSKKVFENFIVGPSNNMAYASTLAMAQKPGQTYPVLFIHSSSGLGKTHLLHAAGNKIKDLHPEKRIAITTGSEFMTEMMEAVANRQGHIFRRKYSEKVDVLMIDDIQEIKTRPGTQKELFYIFNEFYNKKKQLFFTGNCPPHEIEGLDPQLCTRLAWGLVLDIKQPDIDTRLDILKQKAVEEDIFIPNDVLVYVANNVRGHIRQLEGALIRLGAYSSVMQVDIDLEIAKEQLKLFSGKNQDGKSAETIIYATSRHFRIPEVDIISPARPKKITFARHLAMYLCHKHLSLTLDQIGAYFSGRDHTTVLYAVDKIRKALLQDSEMAQLITELEKEF